MKIKFQGMEFWNTIKNENLKVKILQVEHDNRFFGVSLSYKRRDLVEMIICPDQKKTPVNMRKISFSWWNRGAWLENASDPVGIAVKEYFRNKLKIG